MRKTPAVSCLEVDEQSLKLALELSEDIAWFEGHFPRQAVLPGIIQLEWMRSFAEELCGPIRITSVPLFKCTHPLIPGQTIILDIAVANAEKTKLKFSYSYWDHGVLKEASRGSMNVCQR